METGIQSVLSSDVDISGFMGFSSALIESKIWSNQYFIPEFDSDLDNFLRLHTKFCDSVY